MRFLEILLIGIGLSMDAFSVSICKGLTTKKFSWKMALTCGLWFGIFQALMPLIGYFLGAQFERFITSVDHWIAFGLLFLIGANMIREALSKRKEGAGSVDEAVSASENALGFKTMLLLAVATSIDALAVGISFACTGYRALSQLTLPLVIIGVVSFLFSILGTYLGFRFGRALARRLKPGILGGIILILIGVKILVSHLWGVG